MNRVSIAICMVLALSIAGCATTGGKTPGEQRKSIVEMRKDVLTELYKLQPKARAQVAKAPGYAVFSNVNINIIFASFGGGYGVVRNNKTGKDTYMKMGEVGIGLGLGAKDFRAVFVFNTTDSLKRFVDKGWAFGAHADAVAKAEDKGAAVGGEVVVDDISIYQITKTGLALQATVKGTKYWKDDSLN